MKCEFKGRNLIVTREEGDHPVQIASHPTDPSSHLYYRIKEALNARGFDLIKKRLQKDGHLMGDDSSQYLRCRGPRSQSPHVFIYDGIWQVRIAAEDYARDGTVRLDVMYDVFEEQPDCRDLVESCQVS